MIRSVLLSAFTLFTFFSYSQEVITDLDVNPSLKNHYDKEIPKPSAKNPDSTNNDTLTLPFFDDFSGGGLYPDTALWMDDYAFINEEYPVEPISIGVATLDGVDEKGHPYDDSKPNTYGLADNLTSNPIRMSGYTPLDSLYFSFYYQGEGYGNAPERDDSLLLQFRTDSIYYISDTIIDTTINDTTIIDSIIQYGSKWIHIWSDTGQDQSNFKFVILPIVKQEYFTDRFQFRFRNYATLSGNLDQWHIDYVFLDENRTVKDSSFFDVAFVYNGPSLLKNYEAMPWIQFKDNQSDEIVSSYSVWLRNNLNTSANTPYSDELYNEDTLLKLTNEGNFNIAASSLQEVTLNLTIPTINGSDSVNLSFKNFISLSGDIEKSNDTITRYQKFHNYYAYDDGTAEKGYGLNTKNGRIAYRFVLNKPDYLRAIAMYFNEVLEDVSDKNFYLTVWTSLDPEVKVFEQPAVKPIYENELNRFHYYKLDTVEILIQDTFYLGWKQTTTDVLNIGLDKNTDANSNMFYNVGGDWLNSTIPGSWMIRPLLGDTLPPGLSVKEDIIEQGKILLYPNPATNYLHIYAEFENFNNGQTTLTIFNSIGNQVYSNNYSKRISLEGFDSGIYFLKLIDPASNNIYSKSFVVIR
ncbi:MAG: hypothetical protein COC01_04445 [Bacteroidetes bacterium]|nr:T9SS type A sorting domain-containing protein [Bacteroidia bacterium]MBN4052440.1 T9SS type A sorting domain-containing protein [Sphingobacteriaceae bacterium AH-315-L07]PCH68080.1 MAG: hypothetical protein COC01_04445 [Bacteroidota bacterium]